MPEVTITIGGREFDVACQDGEEHFLHSAAQMLDAEAQTLLGQIGRMPESRMLLMAGLLLADKAAGADDRVRVMEKKVGAMTAELERAREATLAAEAAAATAMPQDVQDALADLAARAESLAQAVEEASGTA